jgi:endonuclease/exonuclease/phosphatase family metal-dependent hydrolase
LAIIKHQVLMGDMNTHASDLLHTSPLRDLGLLAPQVEATFPSWRPQRCLDHILLSPTLTLERVQVLDAANLGPPAGRCEISACRVRSRRRLH